MQISGVIYFIILSLKSIQDYNSI